MPSIITHTVVSLGASRAVAPKGELLKLSACALVCSVLPDADTIGFAMGVPYGHYFGHRGFFHSPFFALLVGLVMVLFFYRNERTFSRKWWLLWLFFFLIGASHGVLDAFTNGGRGIALLVPFDDTRYFFPWTPIMVSPIGIRGFFTAWGLDVILTEVIWVWLPLFLALLTGKLMALKLRPDRPDQAEG